MDNIGIQYIHLPGLGIVADKRKNLNSFADYSALFEEYKKVVLPDQSEAVNSIADLIETNQRVALTCFEADHNYCHRSRVADEVIRNQKGSYDLIHI